ncbi:MAG: hypothetical protein OHK0013_22110 [Sandaracinaceae bacterium]
METPPIVYALMRSPAEAVDFCSRLGSRWQRPGCAFGPELSAANEPFLVHEIVHNVLRANGLEGVPALQEGTAEVYGGTLWNEPSTERSLPLASLTDVDAFQAGASMNYSAAASLVSFLLDVGGEARLVALMARTTYDTDLAGLDAAALEVYGRSMTDLHAEWSARPAEPGSRLARPVFQCSAAPFELGTTQSVFLERGVSESISRGGSLRTFTVPRDGMLRVLVAAPLPAITVLSCERGPLVVSEQLTGRDAEVTAAIPAGRYAIWVTAELLEGDLTELEVSLFVDVE